MLEYFNLNCRQTEFRPLCWRRRHQLVASTTPRFRSSVSWIWALTLYLSLVKTRQPHYWHKWYLSPSLLVVFQFWKLLFEIILILEKVKYHNLHISTVKKWIDLLFTGCKWKSHECQPLFKEENLSCWWSIVNHHKVYSRAWGCESSKFAGTLWKYENHIQYT